MYHFLASWVAFMQCLHPWYQWPPVLCTLFEQLPMRWVASLLQHFTALDDE